MPVTVIVPGRPVAKERPRVGRHGTYTPTRTREWEDRVGWTVRGKYPGLTPDGQGEWELAVAFMVGDRRRRDLDNLVKSVMDALNGVVWVDDSQVTRIVADLERGTGWATMLTAKERTGHAEA